MNGSHRIFAVMAVAVFIVSACLVFAPSEDVDADAEPMKIVRSIGYQSGYHSYGTDPTYGWDTIYKDMVILLEDRYGNDVGAIAFDPSYASSWTNQTRVGTSLWVMALDDFPSGYCIGAQEIVTFTNGYVNEGALRFNSPVSASDRNEWRSFYINLNIEEDSYYTEIGQSEIEKVEFVLGVYDTNGVLQSGYTQTKECYQEFEWSDGTKYTTTISYELDSDTGVSNMPSDQTVTDYIPIGGASNIDVTLSNNTPTKSDGSSFQGWSTTPNASASMYGVGERIDVSPDATITLYPVFTQPNRTVTFMIDGEVYDTVTVQNGQFVTRPSPDPVSDDPTMIFADWYTDNTYQTKFPFNQAITANTTIFGTWMERLDIVTNPVVHGSITKVDGTASTYYFDASGSEGNILWDFGNGDTSTAKQGTYYYDEPGDYNGKLTVTDSFGENPVVWEFSVHVEDVDGEQPPESEDPDNTILWIVAGILAAIMIVLVIVRFVL